MAKRKSKKPSPQFVRIYAWEMDTPAWTGLSTDAKALLVHFRKEWKGEGNANRISLSVRQIEQHLNIGQRRAQKARDELLDRGWIRVMQEGAFSRKVRHATVYALTNEPIHDGQVAPKDYMRFSTVVNSATDGSHFSYRDRKITPKKPQVGSHNGYREPDFSPPTVAVTATHIYLPRGVAGTEACETDEDNRSGGVKARAGALEVTK